MVASISGLTLLFTGALSAAVGGPCSTRLDDKPMKRFKKLKGFLKRNQRKEEERLSLLDGSPSSTLSSPPDPKKMSCIPL